MANEPYRRLGRSSFGIASTASLWLGRDHLLVVTRMPGGEGYRRFFFRDIQAVVIRSSSRRGVLNAILGVLAALNALVLLSFVGERNVEPLVVLAGLSFTVLIALLVANNVRGPTCETRLKTAVQYQPLPALGRRRRALAVLEILRPLILAAQQERGGPAASEAGN